MKLRLRALESKETLRVEVPNPCSFGSLYETLSRLVPASTPSSLHLSLNRKDELRASSAQESLQSLGITSGDLIFYTFNPDAFSPAQTLTLDMESSLQEPKSEESEITVSDFSNREDVSEDLSVRGQLDTGDSVSGTQKEETLTLDFSGEDNMDVDAEGSLNVLEKKLSEYCFLRRILREELGEGRSDHKLMVIAVHAVMLEMGFVGFDSVLGMRVDRFRLPEEWPSVTSRTISLWYTLPELLGNGSNISNSGESVVLKFQNLGHFVNVYGCLAKGKWELHHVCLNEYRFAPIIDLVRASHESNFKESENDGSTNSFPESEVFEFWKIVKDGVALPLLIDICEKSGLLPPPCFMRLPTELKLKIMESLAGVDVAKLGCVCSELRYLSSNKDLWKQKVMEEFGDVVGMEGVLNWKERFAFYWESKKKTKRDSARWQGFPRIDRPFYFPVRRDPNPFGIPSMMIGGDYDRLPGLGIPSPLAQPGQVFPHFRMRRNFSPHCNLGGFSG